MSQKQYAYFSAAIRDGAKLRPQAFGQYFVGNASCAVGAGMEACCGYPELGSLDDHFDVLDQAFPYLTKTTVQCPVCAEDGWLWTIAAQLNDDHKWTREQIADWLYAEEEKLGFVTVVDDNDRELSIIHEGLLAV